MTGNEVLSLMIAPLQIFNEIEGDGSGFMPGKVWSTIYGKYDKRGAAPTESETSKSETSKPGA
ncbi:MAG: hypothetical protein AAB399_01480 [Patescibacteria group bacterium]